MHKTNKSKPAMIYTFMNDDASVSKWFNLGIDLLEQCRWVETEEAIRNAIEIDPTYALAWNELGIVLGRQRKYEESADALRKAIEFLNSRFFEKIGI